MYSIKIKHDNLISSQEQLQGQHTRLQENIIHEELNLQ